MTIVVCGGREYDDGRRVFAVLDALHARTPVTRVAHGGARGADWWANEWLYSRRIDGCVYTPDWNKHGKAAGPIRNRLMLDTERPHVLVAFPGGRGTADCVRAARERHIPVLEVPADG
jgi:hypothetical protein